MVELLLVTLYTVVIFTLFLVALNPSKQLSENRNAQRLNDITMLMSGVYQWSIDHGGEVPKNITEIETEICSNQNKCEQLINLSMLTQNQTYLLKLPQDPLNKTSNGIGYTIKQEKTGRITISAPHAERGENISLTQ